MKLLLTLVWAFLFCWVISNGDLSAETAVINGVPVHGMARSFHYTPEKKGSILCYVLGYFWGIETVTLFFQFIVAYSCCIWFFTPCNPDFSKPDLDPSPVWRGIGFALRYHLGSLALGGGLVALFKLVHALFSYIAAQARASENRVAECIASTFMCCVWCFEQVLRFITITRSSSSSLGLRTTSPPPAPRSGSSLWGRRRW